MANAKDYQAAADWAEHEMTLKPGSTTALRGPDAAKRGREVLAKALGGRPSIDPDAKPGQHARVRQVRVSTDVDARIEVLAADRHVKASDIIREALAAYLASAVSPGEKGASRTRRSRTAVAAKAARGRTPAKAVPAVTAKRVSASAKTARTRSGVSKGQVNRRDRVVATDSVRSVGEKLITVGQQMGNTTVKTSQRYSTMTSDENAVN